MNQNIRISELKALFYRLGLAYFFYFIARLLFTVFNYDLLQVYDFSTFMEIQYHGIAFDNPAIFYTNSLFVLLSLLPFFINTKMGYQKGLFYLYFITNTIAYVFNFIDIGYYPFSQTRTTTATFSVFENEQNKGVLFGHFIESYWYIILIFVLLMILWVFLYKKVKVVSFFPSNKLLYVGSSVVSLLLVVTLMIGGIRGDFKYSTRPINMLDASKYVAIPSHADAVLNTPFSIIRTIGKNHFKEVNFVDEQVIKDKIQPIKQYSKLNNANNKPNIVIFIVESFGREYIGSFNENTNISNYKSYTPFVDSLANHSLIFPNGFANGRQSIHGMSSIFAGIPSFRVAYTSSPYANQRTQSMVSTLKEMGYSSSFFHGAPNGSMGFLGFSKILGFDNYYGLTEYDNPADSDGIWGIWDKPFLKYMKKELDKKKEPFLATVFTLSSHDPYKVPAEAAGKFPVGDIPIHQCIGYTDDALRTFFKEAKKEDWFNNTIFILTADHTNQKFYEEYKAPINRFAVPLLFYKPDNSLAGVDTDLAQQIDIYPTVLDLVGYDKDFRSWGRSLVSDSLVIPYAITHTGNLFQFLKGDYVLVFSGEKTVGLYLKTDLTMENDLQQKVESFILKDMEESCKAFIQDYMSRIVKGKL